MPAIIEVVVNATNANINIAQTNQQLDDQNNKNKSITTKIKENWVLISQVATSALSVAQKAAEASGNVALLAGIQATQTGIQVAQTEIGIYRLGVEAVAAATLGQYAQAAGLTVLAGLLEGTLISSMILKQQQQNNQKNADELARQLESYI